MIPWLQRWTVSGKREFTPEGHHDKSHVPSLGACMFVPVVICLGCVYSVMTHDWYAVWLSGIMTVFAAIGVYDDLCKVWHTRGISEALKFSLQATAAGVFAIWWYLHTSGACFWITPFGCYGIRAGMWVIPWIIFMLVGVSNAVNITDGIDGLATTSILYHVGSMTLVLHVLAPLWYIDMAWHAVWLAIIAGACAGFLWFNAYPARVFMGDAGSLSLGALCAAIAVMSGTEWLLICTMMIPCIETCSVILQVLTYKLFGTRLFRIAPLHHHFETIGWHESHIVVRALILSTMVLSAVITFIAATS